MKLTPVMTAFFFSSSSQKDEHVKLPIKKYIKYLVDTSKHHAYTKEKKGKLLNIKET